MAKSFKNLISEVAEPKTGGERAFKSQHIIQRYDAQPAGQDFIFNGDQPPRKRLADYIKGQDAAAYDQAYRADDGDGSIADTMNGPVAVESVEDNSEELLEDPSRERPMMMGQLRTMAHNLQGIARYISTTQDPEEWFQNKLAGVAKEMQTLYGYATAETMAMGESLEEASCGCGPDCDHCGGDHSDAEVGSKCDCCGNMVEDVEYKVDGRRASFKEKAKALGYVKKENAFMAKAAKEKLNGKKKMVMGNKEYPVTMKKANAEKIDSELDEAADVDISKLSADQLAKLDKLMTSLSKGNLSDAEKEKAAKAAMADMGVVKEGVELKEGILETLALIWFAGKVLPIIVGVSLLAIGGGLMGLAKILDKIDSIKAAMKDRKVKAFIKKNMGKPIDAKMKAEIEKLFPPRVADKIRDDLERKGVIKENLKEARRPKPPQISKGTAKGSISAKGIRGKGMKKFDVDVSVDNGKFSFRIQDESGKFQTVDIKTAARMLGESAEYLAELDAKTQKKFVAGAKAMKSYAAKNGGVDKKDFMMVAKMMDDIARVNLLQAGPILSRLNRAVDDMDTDVRERIYAELKKVGLVEEKKQKGRKLTPKEMRRALATAKAQPKDKVSLKKAPFDIPKEALEEKVTFRTGIITLDDGQKVKLSRQDADLLTKFFRDLNPRNSTEMRKVLVKDKAGFEEILGFAREAL